jgi:splicing factor 3A subunit 3
MEVLERQRNAHEDIERMEQAIVIRLAEEPRTKYDSLLTEHQVAQFLNGIQQQSDFLVESYRDENKYIYQSDGTKLNFRARENEIESMSGSTNEFDQFYKQLVELKEIHRLHPNLQVEDLEKNYRKRSREEMEEDRKFLMKDVLTLAISNMFTGEESWGRFLDLNIYHERFLNLRGVRTNISYIDYLKTFQGFRHLRRQTKNEDYLKYLIQLQEYLESFLKRVQPLVNHEKLMNKIGVDFEKSWENGTAPGQQDTQENTATTNGSPLFCEACQKTYSKETVFNAHLESKQHKKNVERANAEKRNDPEDDPEPLPGHMTREQRRKEISRREYTILKLCQGERLSQVIPATINNVERRSLLSDRERQVHPSDPLFSRTNANIWCRKNFNNYKTRPSIHPLKHLMMMKKTDQAKTSFTTPSNSLLGGMANQSPSGSINYMVSARNIPVKSVETWYTLAARISKNILENLIIFMD